MERVNPVKSCNSIQLLLRMTAYPSWDTSQLREVLTISKSSELWQQPIQVINSVHRGVDPLTIQQLPLFSSQNLQPTRLPRYAFKIAQSFYFKIPIQLLYHLYRSWASIITSYITCRKIAKPRVYQLLLIERKNKSSDQNQNSIYSIYSDALLLERLTFLLIPIGRDLKAAIIDMRNRKQNKCQYHWIILCPSTAAVPRKEMIYIATKMKQLQQNDPQLIMGQTICKITANIFTFVHWPMYFISSILPPLSSVFIGIILSCSYANMPCFQFKMTIFPIFNSNSFK